MYKTKVTKAIYFATLLSLISSIQIFNIPSPDSRNRNKNIHLNDKKSYGAEVTSTRRVAEFKSEKTKLTSKNFFKSTQDKNLSTNVQVRLFNTASFKYQVSYSNYNDYGAKTSNFNVTVEKNTTKDAINIGGNLIPAVEVKVFAPEQKWANLITTKKFVPDNSIIPTSIHYAITGSKKINDATVLLNIIYANRTNPQKQITTNVGFFNVNNTSKNVVSFMSTSLGKGLVSAICSGILVGLGIGLVTWYGIYKYQFLPKTLAKELMNFIGDKEAEELPLLFYSTDFTTKTNSLLEKVNSSAKIKFLADSEVITKDYLDREADYLKQSILGPPLIAQEPDRYASGETVAKIESSSQNISEEALSGDITAPLEKTTRQATDKDDWATQGVNISKKEIDDLSLSNDFEKSDGNSTKQLFPDEKSRQRGLVAVLNRSSLESKTIFLYRLFETSHDPLLAVGSELVHNVEEADMEKILISTFPCDDLGEWLDENVGLLTDNNNSQ